ncbi:MAG: hypothetical protein AAF558_00355 [Verrucomicrobiota bacterium]
MKLIQLIWSIIFLLSLIAAARPLFISKSSPENNLQTLPSWPQYWLGQHLQPVDFEIDEQRFYQAFPGKAAAFTDGNRRIIFRWITRPSRKVHPVRHCLSAQGFSIEKESVIFDKFEHPWRRLQATKKQKTFVVLEQIQDGEGKFFTDVSAWFWNGILGKSKGPWLNRIIFEPVSD